MFVASMISTALVIILQQQYRHDKNGDGKTQSPSLHQAIEVLNATVPIPGLLCDDAKNALVFYPSDIDRHSYPLVVFSPGDFMFVYGWNVETRYVPVLEGIARQGFVVASPLEAGGWCRKSTLDQLRVVDFVNEHDDHWLWSGVDTTRNAGVIGISMGGLVSFDNAIGEKGVGAAVAISPYWDGLHSWEVGQPKYPIKHIDKPVLFITGSLDVESPWWFNQQLYESMPVGVPSAIAVMQNYTHHTIRLSPGLVLIAGIWFNCILSEVPTACAALKDRQLLLQLVDEIEGKAELEDAWFESKLTAFSTKTKKSWTTSWTTWANRWGVTWRPTFISYKR